MRSVWAMAVVTLRGAVRSRVVLTLLILLAAAVIGLPMTVEGDGTLAGKAHILVGFTLGAVGAVVGLTALWSGCAAVSSEVADHRIHLLVTKPVRPVQVWLGKWLGLLLLQAILLSVSALILFSLLLWTLRPSRLSPEDRAVLREEVWVCLASALPASPGMPAALDRAFREWAAAHDAKAVPPRIQDEIRRQMESRSFLVPPGEARSWVARLPADPAQDRPLRLQFRMIKSQLDLEPVAGIWAMGSPETSAPTEIRGAWRPQTRVTIPIPSDALQGSRDVVLGYINLDPGQTTVLFDPDHPMEILMPLGTFEANFLRAVLLLFLRLALLTAVGLSAGTLFSFPVAALCAFTLAFLMQMSGEISAMAARNSVFEYAHSEPSEILDRTLRTLYSGLDAVLRPLGGPNTARSVAAGRRIPWSAVGKSLVIHLGLYGGMLALLSASVFRRRELGAPP